MDEKRDMEFDPMMPDMRIPTPDLPDGMFEDEESAAGDPLPQADAVPESDTTETYTEPEMTETDTEPETAPESDSVERLAPGDAEVVSEGRTFPQTGYQYQSDEIQTAAGEQGAPQGNPTEAGGFSQGPKKEDYTQWNTWQSQGGGGQQYNRPPQKSEPSSVLGILSIIFGIISLVFFCSCINIITGVAAIIFGIIQLSTGEGKARGISIAGIVTAAISIVFFFMFWGAIFGNSNIGESVIEQYGDGNMEDFLENYMERYGLDKDGNPIEQAPGNANQL